MASVNLRSHSIVALKPASADGDTPASDSRSQDEVSSVEHASLRRGWFGHTRLLAIPLALIATTAGAGGWVINHWGVVETDDAQLQGTLTPISSRLPGYIDQVAVKNNQTVRPGQLLFSLDDRNDRASLLKAEADLAQARGQAAALADQALVTAGTAAANGNLAAADEQSARAQLELSRVALGRLEFLLRQGGVSQQDVDQARATYRQAEAQATRSQATRQQAQASVAQVGADRLKAEAAAAEVRQASVAVAAARLRLSYDRIVAPEAGRIGAKQAEPGMQVEPSQPVMTLVGSRAWVEANFKETQLDALRPGQPAEVRLDAFPGKVFHGHVASIAPASGARFALLPPDNATGNFTKVVQRITARISLDSLPISGPDARIRNALLPGLSANVQVRRP